MDSEVRMIYNFKNGKQIINLLLKCFFVCGVFTFCDEIAWKISVLVISCRQIFMQILDQISNEVHSVPSQIPGEYIHAQLSL